MSRRTASESSPGWGVVRSVGSRSCEPTGPTSPASAPPASLPSSPRTAGRSLFERATIGRTRQRALRDESGRLPSACVLDGSQPFQRFSGLGRRDPEGLWTSGTHARLSDLLHEAGRGPPRRVPHHRRRATTIGPRSTPTGCIDHSELPEALGQAPTRSHLVHELVESERAPIPEAAPEARWEDFYASGSSTASAHRSWPASATDALADGHRADRICARGSPRGRAGAAPRRAIASSA